MIKIDDIKINNIAVGMNGDFKIQATDKNDRNEYFTIKYSVPMIYIPPIFSDDYCFDFRKHTIIDWVSELINNKVTHLNNAFKKHIEGYEYCEVDFNENLTDVDFEEADKMLESVNIKHKILEYKEMKIIDVVNAKINLLHSDIAIKENENNRI